MFWFSIYAIMTGVSSEKQDFHQKTILFLLLELIRVASSELELQIVMHRYTE